jgi:signal transduction histidine kinase/AraC-like DNA-binding protein/ligand-binding sensor domain-containing protein
MSQQKYYLYLYSVGLIILLSLISIALPAQNTVKQISNINGLSNNSVNCFFEDSNHILWIGTWEGLNVYNGHDFKIYRCNKNDPHSISNNIIKQIIEQDETYLWIITGNGLNRFNRTTQVFDHFPFEHKFSSPNSQLIVTTSQKRILCYEKNAGLLYFDENRQEFLTVNVAFSSPIEKMFIDSSDNLYFLTMQQEVLKAHVFQDKNGKIIIEKCVKINTSPVYNLFLSNQALIICYDKYITITHLDNSFIQNTNIPFEQSKFLLQAAYNNTYLFVYGNKTGCIKFDIETGKHSNIENISKSLSIFALYYMSSQDILWVGTDGQGIFYTYEYYSPFRVAKTDFPVRSFCKIDSGIMLIGTKGEGIKLWDSYEKQIVGSYTQANGLISNSVYTIKKNRSGDIFIGTEGIGINILPHNRVKMERLKIPAHIPSFRFVYSILFTHNDSLLWLGTIDYGLIRIRLLKENNQYIVGEFKNYTLSEDTSKLSNYPTYPIIKGANENELWVGTRGNGLYQFNIETEQFQRIEDIEKTITLTDNDIITMMRDSLNDLWVGTSYGLNHLQQLSGHAFNTEYLNTTKGLKNNNIRGIVEDKNRNIWVSTSLGISFINTQTEQVINYTSQNGLQNNEFTDCAYYIDNKGIIYLGNGNGFCYFDPDKMHLRDFAPTINISNLKIYNTNQDISKRIRNNTLKLAYNEHLYVTFTFVAQDFINNENCEYRYRVQDFSEKWIENGNNPNIVITKLPPGKRLLEIQCSNGDKVWNPDIYKLYLEVAYPWWLSFPAFFVYFVIIAVSLLVIRSMILYHIRLNRQIWIDNIEKRQQQKIHESKLQFFTNVAHEFFTPLTLIYSSAQHLLEKADLDSYIKRYILIIKNNADRMQKLINELMEFRKVETGHTLLKPEIIDIQSLIDYISDNYTEMADENKIAFHIQIENVSPFGSDRNSLEKIIFNLISNAFKYTPSHGYIHIHIRQNENGKQLYFSIRNSGKGLTDNQMDTIFNRFTIFENSQQKNTQSTGIGLNLTKSLIELLGGTITVSSRLGEYVEFNVILHSMELPEKEIYKAEEPLLALNKHPHSLVRENISILIIDDEKDIRELLKDILRPYYQVAEASDGEEGLKMVAENQPDIIISDIMMPKLDGIGFINQLKSNEKTAHIPVISVSAKNSIEDHITAFDQGVDLYISKPFHPRHILSAIENIFQKHLILKDYFQSQRSNITVKEGVSMHREDEKLLKEIISYIEKNREDESLDASALSEAIGISKSGLYQKLKDLTGKTPSELIRNIRLEHAALLLKTTKLTVSEIIFKVGFSNKSYFYREFTRQFGITPKEYRFTAPAIHTLP